MEFPPDLINMDGMIVSTSIKFEARARKAECHKNALKFIFEFCSDSSIQ
jgi:hypothetical protein